MSGLRKITVEVPDVDLTEAKAFTGKGITETVREALRRLRAMRAQQRAIELRGKVKFSTDEPRSDEE